MRPAAVFVSFSLMALAKLCSPQSTFAGNTESVVFTFDAQSSRISTRPVPIRAGSPIALVITHPKTFRESYEVKFETIEFHEIALPELFKGIVLVGTTKLDPLPIGATRALNFSKVGQDTLASPPEGPLPASLRLPYDLAVKAAGRIDIEAQLRFQHVMTIPLTSRLASDLMLAPENAQARQIAAEAIEAVHADWINASADEPDSAADSEIARYRARDILYLFDVVTRRWANDWDQAAYVWDRAYSVYRAGKPIISKSDSIANAADSDVQMCKKWMEGLKGKIEKIRPDVESFVELASVALDPVRTPNEIRQTTVASGDEVTVSIEVHRFALVDEKQKALPTAPQLSVSQRVPVYGRWTLDASAGFLITGLRQQNFVAAPSADSTGTGKVVREGSHDEADIAPGFFAHYVWTSRTRSVFWALGPTLGISTSNPIRYFAGASLQFGRSARLAVSGGVAWGKLRVLNGEHEDTQLVTTPLSVAEVTRKDWGVGVSFAINPRFPSKKT
jgi:hypothetical protein